MSDNTHVLDSKILKGGVLKVTAPVENSKAWLISREEALRPEKGEYVLEKFLKRFPNIRVKDADMVYSMCSRSAFLTQWLSDINLTYIDQIKIPAYAIDLIDSKKVKDSFDTINQLNSLNAKKAAAIKEASDLFKLNLSKIENDAQYKYAEKLSNEVIILKLNTTDLPLTLQLAIENFTPAANDAFPDTKSFAREMLYQYKKSLFLQIKEKPDMDIEKVIDELKEK
jgi:hypothetical protein